jgi:hypothetical protein
VDIIAHVTTWEEEALKHLPLVLMGKRPPRYSVTDGGIDAFNAQTTEQRKNLSLLEVFRHQEEVHHRLIELIEGVREDQLGGDTRFRHPPRYVRALSKACGSDQEVEGAAPPCPIPTSLIRTALKSPRWGRVSRRRPASPSRRACLADAVAVERDPARRRDTDSGTAQGSPACRGSVVLGERGLRARVRKVSGCAGLTRNSSNPASLAR